MTNNLTAKSHGATSSLEPGSHPPSIDEPSSFWRSLEEWARAVRLDDLRPEFPDPSVEVLDEHSRRDFLRFMAASLALAGSAVARYQPSESIVPYVEAPRGDCSGQAVVFRLGVPMTDGFACGVLVKSHMGRPINLEGNPDHPASLGAIDTFGQATF